MGMFRIEIESTGNHGCDRHVKAGNKVYGCRSMNCPDCLAREFVKKLQDTSNGYQIKATLTHWPGQADQVIDDLVTGERTGNF